MGGFRAATAANAMGRALEVRPSQTPLILNKKKYKAPSQRLIYCSLECGLFVMGCDGDVESSWWIGSWGKEVAGASGMTLRDVSGLELQEQNSNIMHFPTSPFVQPSVRRAKYELLSNRIGVWSHTSTLTEGLKTISYLRILRMIQRSPT